LNLNRKGPNIMNNREERNEPAAFEPPTTAFEPPSTAVSPTMPSETVTTPRHAGPTPDYPIVEALAWSQEPPTEPGATARIWAGPNYDPTPAPRTATYHPPTPEPVSKSALAARLLQIFLGVIGAGRWT
jgi:hypothetical protein